MEIITNITFCMPKVGVLIVQVDYRERIILRKMSCKRSPELCVA